MTRRLLLAVLLTLLSACAPDDDDGPCEEGATRCLDERNFETCVEGAWDEGRECEAMETNLGPVITWCFEGGSCGVRG